MRVALCLSGNPKFFEVAYPYIKKNIIESNDCDVFLHAWHNSENIGNHYGGVSWTQNQDTIKQETPRKLLELYDPKFFKIEPQKEDLFPYNKTENDYPKTQGENIAFANFSMFYSMMESVNLCYAYENSHKFKYDAIIRCRFDLAVLDELNLEKYEIHRLSDEIGYADLCRNKSVISDWLFWGNSNNMRYVMNAYLMLDRYVLNERVMLCGEEILTHHLNKINCKRIPKPISGFLVRDKYFNNKQFGATF